MLQMDSSEAPAAPARRRRDGPSQTGEPLGVPLRLRVTRETAASIAAAAAEAGETDASWIRGVLARALDLGPDDRQRVRRYGRPSVDQAALMALRMQLQQLGGLLVQTAKVARTEGLPHHQAAEVTLAEIRAAAVAIQALQAGEPAG